MQERETGRVEAFSDGVFAIAVTLLILDIHVPQARELVEPGGLTAALLRLWPSFFAFVLSFVFVLITWINHHRLFTHIRRVNGAFLFLNGFLLLWVTFVPFPTALLAAYIQHPKTKAAAIIYAGTCLWVAVGFQLLWRYASHRNRLLKRNVDAALTAQISREYNRAFPLFVLAFALAFFSVPAGLGLIGLLVLFFAVTGFTATDTDRE
jgi:uncharacterized membrane protein